mmetsp:Transcript_6286/g.15070  ORF Transcript_6286/g.15070 Transcript_6286/m.15070 type:complete len:123 (-) Transcript_6286:2237-2605(-)
MAFGSLQPPTATNTSPSLTRRSSSASGESEAEGERNWLRDRSRAFFADSQSLHCPKAPVAFLIPGFQSRRTTPQHLTWPRFTAMDLEEEIGQPALTKVRSINQLNLSCEHYFSILLGSRSMA